MFSDFSFLRCFENTVALIVSKLIYCFCPLFDPHWHNKHSPYCLEPLSHFCGPALTVSRIFSFSKVREHSEITPNIREHREHGSSTTTWRGGWIERSWWQRRVRSAVQLSVTQRLVWWSCAAARKVARRRSGEATAS